MRSSFNLFGKAKLLLVVFLFSIHCETKKGSPSEPVQKHESKQALSLPEIPEPNPDSLLFFTAKQVQFGPRVPGTASHKACGDWLVAQFQRYDLKVIEQIGTMKGPGNKPVPIRNIIASYNPEAKDRIILSAHWDTRPFADQDKKDQHKPIPGANDGASGVSVLLEIARILPDSFPIGIDFILWDAEDMGLSNEDNSFCLGSQYWTTHPHTPNYFASYCINLDMVGATNAVFPQESYSRQFAPELVEEIWRIAIQLGYGHLFLFAQPDHPILDDHYYVFHGAKIPAIDIIHFDPQTLHFFPYWHTHQDELSHISGKTLYAVCHVLTTWLIHYAKRTALKPPS